MENVTLMTPGVIEAGLMSVASCPVCAENLNAAFSRADLLFGGPAWEPRECPDHPDARWK